MRIIQEFIQNSIKHANCKNLKITLTTGLNNLKLTIEDDGRGFDITKKSLGIGLKNIKQRIEIIGGTFSLESEINNGTKLTLNLNQES